MISLKHLDIGSNFLNTLADLAENILTQIQPKAIDDIFFTGVSYRSYVEQVIKQMERKEKGNITSLFEATNELAFNELRMDALKEFERLWNQQNEINAYSPIDPELFEETGKTILETVTQEFSA
ncbi:unnamed protein product, partial [Mesorhabditis belari]|uniref:Uncharacterized protein n=1 Tax=Mesorhabditis belari TaxID=2138241 RepID=A0AAF3ECA8_9BILA